MSRTSRALTAITIGYAQLGLSTLFGLWFTPFLLRHIGRSDFGLWSAGMPILAYVSLVDFGVMTIFQRDVAFALGEAQGDIGQAVRLPIMVGSTLRLVLFQMPALLAGIAVAWVCLPPSWEPLHVPLALTLGCLAITFPLRIYHALLTGLQDLRFLGLLAVGMWALGAAVSAVLVFRGWGLNALAVSWSASQVGTYGACYLRVKTRYPQALGAGLPRLARADAASQLRKGFWVIISQLAVMLGSGADLLVIAAVLGPAQVTPYTITDKIVTMLNTVPFMIMSNVQPALSELSSSADRKRLPDVCIALTRVVLLVSGLIATVVLLVNRGFVSWWTGPQEFAGTTLVVLLVTDMLIMHWSAATSYALFSFGYERFNSIINIVGGGLMVLLTVLFTKHLGLIGAPLASIASRVLVSLPALLIATARATGGVVRGILGSVLSWAWRIALCGGAAIAIARVWTPSSPVALVAAGLIAVAMYALVMFPLAVAEPLGAYTRPRIAALQRAIARRA
jgi:O-antigen/teichoic acid export membrane protein